MMLHDPAESAPKRFEAKKRKRLIWLMEHPFVARCLKYHKTTAFIIMVILLVLTLVLLLSVRFYNEKISALPPVRLEHSEDEKIPEPLETVKPYDEPGVDEIPGIGGLE
ncbi:MAG: hypothetical protein GX804_10020 [Lentisphaerae bacterium]|nr:hypothetical protein [Lentisphaerota bacterium]